MITTRRSTIIALGAAALQLAGMLGPIPAIAQEWPKAQPIQIIGGFPTGAGTDIFARLLQEPLSKALDQTIIVENKSGAGGNVGAEFVARARPDGYTFYMGTAGTHAINAALYPKLSFDVLGDFTHVALLVDVPNVLIVNPQILPDVKSCADFVQRARKDPGKLNYASTGNGASTHLAGAQFADAAKIEITHIPYRGTPPALNAMMSGEAQVMFQQSIPIIGQLRAGTFRALGVTTPARIPALPDVPTLAEACGLPGWESTTWYGMFAPKGTPEPVRARMNAEINRIMREPAFGKRVQDLGLVDLATTIEKFRERHILDIAKWKERVKRSGAQVD